MVLTEPLGFQIPLLHGLWWAIDLELAFEFLAYGISRPSIQHLNPLVRCATSRCQMQ